MRYSLYRLGPVRAMLVAGTSALIALILIIHTLSSSQASRSILATKPHTYLAVRTTTGNDAIPDWLGYDSSQLNKPLSQLDAKGQAVKKGQGLECMMKGDLGSAAPSAYQDINDLIKNGYRASFIDHPNSDYISDLGLSKAFQDLGIPFSGWTQMSAGNSFDVRDANDNSKVLYPASHATFTSEIHLDAGAVVATQSYGPEYMAEKFGLEVQEGQRSTPLAKVSDVLFLSWKKLINDRAKGGLRKLEHMFRWNTIVPEVQEHLKMVAGGKSIEQIGEWPGLSYPMTELQGLATLSSPNAKGVTWLLGQHKEDMGVKTIDRVNIFNCPDTYGDAQWCVYLHIVPVKD
ncbi:hypothetical protein Slin15195_G035990 [Septoria linicola]|uniref:Uncharacterized protein n=1 Tax=Septoria linicola TaxID=215465 RepID=A0A9Q9EGR9_9PEZI|nr:hypothetical protein Slin15195_G035990 [Septoria linicola]